MSARKWQWNLPPAAPPEFVAAHPELPPVVASLLYQRGLHTPAEITAFLEPDRRNLHHPFDLLGMEAAARRLLAAIERQEPIAVYGDFDTDGVTAVTLLVQAVRAMGGTIRHYIPHRTREGYGLNIDAIDQLAAEGVRLLVTVDCGISNVVEADHARAVGLDLIVTDHHTPPERLPAAVAVVNPKQPGDTYPFKELVGVGIAYKLVQALGLLGRRPPSLRREDLLDVVALGTVADMGQLVGENRILVREGLRAIRTSQRVGLQELIKVAGLNQASIRASDIGFGLGPRLNAAGRIDDAILSYELLLASDAAAARELAAQLNQKNRERQEQTRETQALARARVEELGKETNPIVILDDAAFPAGVVGLVAARLAEELARPVLLVERGSETSRGSARSVPGFSIIEALSSCADLFVRHGGHAAAAGFTIRSERLPELERRLLAYADRHLDPDLLKLQLEIHAELPLSELSWELHAALDMLEPFGQANPQPVLMSRNVRVLGAWPRGAEGQHLKLRLTDESHGAAFEAIAFRLGHLAPHFSQPRRIDVAYTLDVNEWNGSRSLQLTIRDFRRATA